MILARNMRDCRTDKRDLEFDRITNLGQGGGMMMSDSHDTEGINQKVVKVRHYM